MAVCASALQLLPPLPNTALNGLAGFHNFGDAWRIFSMVTWQEASMANDAPSPLDLMMTTMHRKWAAGDVDEAVMLAKAIAPYVHAKASTARPSDGLSAMRDDQLDELCAHGGNGASATTEDREQPGGVV